MNEKDRQLWRSLVERLDQIKNATPPSPPGLGGEPIKPVVVATNNP
jgi:hypothetical protein